jgi:hypothetical protein
MDDYSLVPVDHQPDFSDVSLVPVDHNPFSADGPTQQTQAQSTQTPAQLAQAQPTQSQPAPSPQPKPTIPSGLPTGDESGSSLLGFFNQLAAPERAESEGVADLVQNHPTVAKVTGAIGLGSSLILPLAFAGAEGLGLLGARAGGSAVADGLAGSTISRGGRAAAGTAARQAIEDAEATLPEGMKRKDFQRLAGFEGSLEDSSQASTEATAEIISGLKSAGISSRSVAAFQKFYENAARDNPSNSSAVHRAALLANILRNFQ